MTSEQVIDLLRQRVRQYGSQKMFAQEHALSQPFINDLLQGRREPSAAILKALGLEKVVTYRKVKQ